MSHKSDVVTKLDNKDYLVKALTALNYEFQVAEGNTLTTRGRYKNTLSDVEILITKTPCGTTTHNEIGFHKNVDGTYTATGDYMFSKIKSKELSETVTVEAKKMEINDRLMNMGFSLTNTQMESGELELQFTRWD